MSEANKPQQKITRVDFGPLHDVRSELKDIKTPHITSKSILVSVTAYQSTIAKIIATTVITEMVL